MRTAPFAQLTSAAWPTAYPRPRGAWTLRSRDGRWGTYHPDTGIVSSVDPAADPALPALRTSLECGTLVSYRVGRRAVVATPTSYIKVVRPKRLPTLVATHQWLGDATDIDSPRTPTVTKIDPNGAVELNVVSGTSLHQLLRSHRPEHLVLAAIDEVAATIAALHRTALPQHLPRRAQDDPQSWVDTVAQVDPETGSTLAATAAALPPLPPLSPTAATVTHGDLHDKNIFHEASGVGLIDLDSVAVGAPEDDVANLAVHLQLRALQSGWPSATGDRLATRLSDSYRAHGALDADRFEVVAAHTWLRLAYIYRFRRASRHHVGELLRRAVQQG